MTSPGPIVRVQGLGKSFPGLNGEPVPALSQLTLEVQAGQLTALVGPDGAGKTTLLRTIAGLLLPDTGRVWALGLDVATHGPAVQARISYMPQRFGLYEDLSVQENLNLYADLHGVPLDVRRTRFGRLLDMMGMAPFTARPAGKLSGGMKQKLGLACTLVRAPDLLLLDEPSVGVDPLSRRDLWLILQQLREEEALSVLVSTAYMDEAERCAQVFVMHQGRLLAEGSPRALSERAAGLTWRVTPPAGTPARALQAELMDARDQVLDAVPQGGEVNCILQPQLAPEASPGDGVQVWERREATLEDAFMMMLADTQRPAPAAPLAAEPIPPATTLPPLSPPSPLSPASPVILVRDLVRRFGDFTAVASTSFEVARGEIFGLLGPNGAGKTTTFRMLCGLLPASSGRLEVAGLDLRTARAQARARVGYVAQKFSLYGSLSVADNLAFFGGAYGLRGRHLKDRIQVLLSQFGLQASARSADLTAGYKQRLAMAVGLLHEPDILFLDEPTSGIDPQARRAFWRTITALAQGGVTIVVTTHFMEEAEYCDRIAIQDAGRMLALGTPQEVREQARHGSGSQGLAGARSMNDAFIAIVEQGRAA